MGASRGALSEGIPAGNGGLPPRQRRAVHEPRQIGEVRRRINRQVFCAMLAARRAQSRRAGRAMAYGVNL